MIELRNITKAYQTPFGPNVVLDNINVTLPTGESIGILGHNGAGKSTLLRVIGGAEMPDLGEVLTDGQVSWPIGFGGGFSGALTGEDNCRFVARIYGQEIDRVIDETRAFADIGSYFYMPIRTYSSGMRARLAFGLSMAIDFSVYLIDEITAVGDANFKRKCREAFDDRAERSSLIMVSHSPDTIRQYCSRCAVLYKGRLSLFDSVDEAYAQYEASLVGEAV